MSANIPVSKSKLPRVYREVDVTVALPCVCVACLFARSFAIVDRAFASSIKRLALEHFDGSGAVRFTSTCLLVGARRSSRCGSLLEMTTMTAEDITRIVDIAVRSAVAATRPVGGGGGVGQGGGQ